MEKFSGKLNAPGENVSEEQLFRYELVVVSLVFVIGNECGGEGEGN